MLTEAVYYARIDFCTSFFKCVCVRAFVSVVHDKCRGRAAKFTWLVIWLHKESCFASTIVHQNALAYIMYHMRMRMRIRYIQYYICRIYSYAYAGKGGKKPTTTHSVLYVTHTHIDSFNIYNAIIPIWLTLCLAVCFMQIITNSIVFIVRVCLCVRAYFGNANQLVVFLLLLASLKYVYRHFTWMLIHMLWFIDASNRTYVCGSVVWWNYEEKMNNYAMEEKKNLFTAHPQNQNRATKHTHCHRRYDASNVSADVALLDDGVNSKRKQCMRRKKTYG